MPKLWHGTPAVNADNKVLCENRGCRGFGLGNNAGRVIFTPLGHVAGIKTALFLRGWKRLRIQPSRQSRAGFGQKRIICFYPPIRSTVNAEQPTREVASQI